MIVQMFRTWPNPSHARLGPPTGILAPTGHLHPFGRKTPPTHGWPYRWAFRGSAG